MAIVKWPDTVYSLDLRGKVGFGNGWGATQYGHTRYGGANPIAAIYQRKMYGTGVFGRDPKKGGRFATSRMRFYRPTNTRQPAQQAWRAVFAEAISAYHALTDGERAILKEQARKRGTSGYHLFISQWLQGRRA